MVDSEREIRATMHQYPKICHLSFHFCLTNNKVETTLDGMTKKMYLINRFKCETHMDRKHRMWQAQVNTSINYTKKFTTF